MMSLVRYVAVTLLGVAAAALPLSAQRIVWERTFSEEQPIPNHTAHILWGERIAVDARGHLHVIGLSGQGGTKRVAYVQLKPDGELVRRLLFYDTAATPRSYYGNALIRAGAGMSTAIAMLKSGPQHAWYVMPLDETGFPRDTLFDEEMWAGANGRIVDHDGGFAIAGGFDNSASIVRGDSNGRFLSRWEYAGVKDSAQLHVEIPVSALCLGPHHGYYLLCRRDVYEQSVPEDDILLLRTDSLGNETWRLLASDTGYSFLSQPFAMASSYDGGAVVVNRVYGHYNFSIPGDYADILRVDSSGHIVWRRSLAHLRPRLTRLYGCRATKDGGFVFAGISYLMDSQGESFATKPYVVKLDSAGRTLWEWEFDHLDKETYLYDIEEGTGDTLVVSGEYQTQDSSDGQNDYRMYVAKLLPPPPAEVRRMPVTTAYLSITPNPARDLLRLSVELPHRQRGTVDIVDMLGRCISSIEQDGTGTTEINVAKLAPGYYQARIIVAGQPLYSRGFVKE